MRRNNYILVILTTEFFLFLLTLACAPSELMAATFFDPHGSYIVSTDGCASCHTTHGTDGPVLLNKSNEKQLCYSCHNGSSSIYNVQKEFGEITVGSSVYPSYHPIPNGTQTCSNCHNPHLTNAIKPDLLEVGPSKASSGNSVCGQCHGTGTSVVGGDVYSPFIGTAHDLKMTAPASGTEIKCVRCHQPHGSPLKPLLQESVVSQTGGVYAVTGNNNTLCFGCHRDVLGGYSGNTVFGSTYHGTKTSSTVALVTYKDTAYSATLCLNCHEPHGKTNVSYYRRADGNDLCMKCHDDSSISHPANYSYQGTDKYALGAHSQIPAGGMLVKGDCLNCHNPHGQNDGTGNAIAKQLKLSADKVCFNNGMGCHSDGRNAVWGVNVAARFSASSNPSSHHSIDPAEQTALGTKIFCTNCHAPHLDNSATRVVDPYDKAIAFPFNNGLSPYINPDGYVYMLISAKHDARPPAITVGPTVSPTQWITGPALDQTCTIKWNTDETTRAYVLLKNDNTGVTSVVYSLSNPNTSHTVNVTGMAVGVPYSYQAHSIDVGGNWYRAPSMPVDNVAPTINSPGPTFSMNGTSATFSWSTNERSTTTVVYSPSDVAGWAYSKDASTSPLEWTHNITLNGLEMVTEYKFQLRSADARGNMVTYDGTIKGSLPPSVPVPIDHAPVLDLLSPTNVSLSCNDSVDPEGDPIEYMFRISTDSTFATGVSSSLWQSGTTWPTTITNYDTVTWFWQVRAKDPWGSTSNWSASSSFSHQGPATPPPPPTSCPNLYVWNGEGFQFITDLTGGALGKKQNTTGKYQPVYPWLPVALPLDSMVEQDGRFTIKLKSERDEVDFFDNVGLMAVDHPIGTRVALNDLVRGKKPTKIYAYNENLRPVKKATYYNDRKYSGGTPITKDITQQVAKKDNLEADGIYGDDNQFTFDLGNLEGATNIKLILSGWTEYRTKAETVTASKKFKKGIKVRPTFLEVLQPDGTWKKEPLQHFNGLLKTSVLDLSGQFPKGTRQYVVRLHGMMRAHIDYVGVDITPNAKFTTANLELLDANLAYKGPSVESDKRDGFDYYKLNEEVIFHQGSFTRFGDVMPLLREVDDKMVVMDTGDELTLHFATLPPTKPGMTRSYILKPWNYYKEYELAKVEPIPFRKMDMNQLPKSLGRYPTELQDYVTEWNTRLHEAGEKPDTTIIERFQNIYKELTNWVSQLWNSVFGERKPDPEQAKVASYKLSLPSWWGVPKSEKHYSLNTDYMLMQVDTSVYTYTYDVNSPGTSLWESDTEPKPGEYLGTSRDDMIPNILSEDSLKWTTDNYTTPNLLAEDGRINYQMARFKVNTSPDKLYSFKIMWKGYGEASLGYNTSVSVWNFVYSRWDVTDSRVIGAMSSITAEKAADYKELCFKCHGGTVPAGVSLGSITHNVAQSYPTDVHGGMSGQQWIASNETWGEFSTTNWSSGTIKAPYARGNSALPCQDCHDTHGSQNIYHFRENLNSVSHDVYVPSSAMGDNAKIQDFCSSCHQGTLYNFHQSCLDCHRTISNGPHEAGWSNNAPQQDDFGRSCLACHKHGYSVPAHGDCHCYLSAPAKAF